VAEDKADGDFVEWLGLHSKVGAVNVQSYLQHSTSMREVPQNCMCYVGGEGYLLRSREMPRNILLF
jgi:hypothetical protein